MLHKLGNTQLYNKKIAFLQNNKGFKKNFSAGISTVIVMGVTLLTTLIVVMLSKIL